MPTREPRSKPLLHVAPLVPVALALAAGIVADRHLVDLRTIRWATIALSFGALALLAGRRRWLGVAALVVAVGALGGAWHHRCWSDLAADDLARGVGVDETPRPVWVRGVVREAMGFRLGAVEGSAGTTRLVLDLTGVMTAEDWRDASGRALVTVVGDRSDLRGGEAVELAGTLGLVPRPLNPGEFDYRNHLRGQGIRLRVMVDRPSGLWSDRRAENQRFDLARLTRRALGAVRTWSKARLEQGLDPRAAPLAAALVLGRREAVDPDVNDAFARTGTTHLLAISGLHMQVLAGALGLLLVAAGVGPKPACAVVLIATLAYALLVGLMPSVVRSAAMTACYCVAGLLDRKGGPANILAAAAIVTLALNPADLFDVGAQLSFLAVAAIIWMAVPLAARIVRGRGLDPLSALERRFEPRWQGVARRGRDVLIQGLVISLVVWLAALPLVALRFHLISPIGIALNLPLIPLTSLALLASGLALAAGAVWSPIGWPFAWVGAISLRATEWIVRWGVAQAWGHGFVPGPSWGWTLGFYGVLAIAAAGWAGRSRGLAAIAAVAVLGLVAVPALEARHRQVEAPPRAEVLAVGHGLAVLIETSDGQTLLYDCGRMRDPSVGRRIVAPALWARGVSRLDAVVLSHADADHYDGLADLLDRLTIAAVLVPPGFAGASNPGAADLLRQVEARGVAVRTIAAGETWLAGATRFTVVHPARDMALSHPDNARSLVVDVAWRDRHALLTGDLDGAGLGALVARWPLPPLDVILAPHHGGKTANPAWLYDRARASLVVVSQRRPAPGTRDPLATLGTPVLRTWQAGAIRLTWSPSGIHARGFLDDEKSSRESP